MIHKTLAEHLVKQVRDEFAACHFYMAASVYFALQGLDGWAKFFAEQSDEERGHALKIVKFLTEVGVSVPMPAIAEVKPKFKSALDALKESLAHEKDVTQSFQTMCKLSVENGDFTTFQFLQWFVDEQVEEESLFGKLIALVESGVNLFQAETMLPAH